MNLRHLLRNAPVRKKLAMAMLVASLMAALLAAAAVLLYETTTFRPRVLAEVGAWVEILRLIMPAALQFHDTSAAEENLRTLGAVPDMDAACVYDKHGRVFASYRVTEADCPPAPAGEGHRFTGSKLELFRAIRQDRESLGSLFLRYALPPVAARLAQYAVMFTFVILALGAVSVMVLSSTRRLIVAPLWELASTARRVTLAKDYSVRAKVRYPDEIGSLTEAFNDMLEKIENNVIERRRAEEALREYSQSLEERVEQRTRELRTAQERLIRQERLAFLGQLAGGVSHELRRPLATIGNAIYFLELIHGEADEKTREHVGIIRNQINNMEKIIHDLLDSLRVRPQAVGQVDLRSWLEDVVERHAPPDGVGVTVEISDELPVVWIDSGQIEQVITNLITNAFQAMPDGGRLHLSAAASDGGVALVVSDTGCGITEDHLKSVFEPLFTTKARGIGLGLTISKNFVEASGGRLDVESTEGEGTTFRIFLPARPPAQLGSEEQDT